MLEVQFLFFVKDLEGALAYQTQFCLIFNAVRTYLVLIEQLDHICFMEAIHLY